MKKNQVMKKFQKSNACSPAAFTSRPWASACRPRVHFRVMNRWAVDAKPVWRSCPAVQESSPAPADLDAPVLLLTIPCSRERLRTKVGQHQATVRLETRPFVNWNWALFQKLHEVSVLPKFMLCPDHSLTNRLIGYSQFACMLFSAASFEVSVARARWCVFFSTSFFLKAVVCCIYLHESLAFIASWR